MSEAKKESAAAAATTTTTTESASLLDSVLKETKVSSPAAQSMIKALVDESLKGTVTWDKNVTRTIQRGIDSIDEAVSKQLAAIMHTREFQKLEGTYRGLKYLVFNSETSEQLVIKLLNAPQKEVQKDLELATEFDQSALWKKLYEEEFGQSGGKPYGALIGDYEFTNHPDDIELLGRISNVAAGAFCPFISAASPKLFGFESFTELSRTRDLTKDFSNVNYAKWNSFRDTEDARYVTLAMPRVLARLPFGPNTKPIDEFNFKEVEINKDGRGKSVPHDQYCWMNAAWVYGARLTDAFAKTNWCTAIRGRENGGTVEGLPAHIFTSDDGDPDLKCPTEIGITDRREAELSKCGFLPLVHYKNEDYAVFFGAQTTQRPKKYDKDDATANAAISARLPYIMASSRVAHYLKVIARDKIGSFMELADVEMWLKNWIAQYVLSDEKATAEMKAKYPLAEAKISVEEVPGAPGSYRAIAHLRPWLQLEELTTSLRMVAKIPAAK